jgi:glycosyltransferase involved in cell wall biosynthesis
MKIWLISAFEPTPVDNTRPMRFMSIADTAIERGHEISFFTTTFQHNSKSHRFQKNTRQVIREGSYEVIFVHSKAYTKNISFGRMMAHYDLAGKLMQELKSQTVRPDVIYISLPPLSTVEMVCKWAEKLDIPVIVDIIDPWPEVFLKVMPPTMRSLAKLPLMPLYKKLKTIMSQCTAVTSISEQYISWSAPYRSASKPTAFFYPAVQFDEVKKSMDKIRQSEKRDFSKLRMVYAGSLSSSYDIPCILEAAELLEKKYPGKTEFLIAGTGPQEALIKEKNLNNVQYLGWLKQDGMHRAFFQSDLGLTQHVEGATQSVTYKLFDYLSAGLPILNSLDSEMAAIIADNKVGFNNRSHDAKGLVANIEKFLSDPELLSTYKENALELTARLGDSKVVYKSLVDFIETVHQHHNVTAIH